jgi:hypothetical protein
MVAALDQYKGCEAEPELFGRQQRDALKDDARRLQSLDGPHARRYRQANTLRNSGDGNGRVLLQSGEDLSIDIVDRVSLPSRFPMQGSALVHFGYSSDHIQVK